MPLGYLIVWEDGVLAEEATFVSTWKSRLWTTHSIWGYRLPSPGKLSHFWFANDRTRLSSLVMVEMKIACQPLFRSFHASPLQIYVNPVIYLTTLFTVGYRNLSSLAKHPYCITWYNNYYTLTFPANHVMVRNNPHHGQRVLHSFPEKSVPLLWSFNINWRAVACFYFAHNRIPLSPFNIITASYYGIVYRSSVIIVFIFVPHTHPKLLWDYDRVLQSTQNASTDGQWFLTMFFVSSSQRIHVKPAR